MIQPARSHATSQPLRVGLAGLGRSGWNIHAATLGRLPQAWTVAAVTDPVQQRMLEAAQTFRCAMCDSFEHLIGLDGLDVIVVATPNHLHTDHAIAAMKSGRHVVCEKPFALNVDDADRMIDVAEQTGRVLAPFQNRRYEPHFLKVRQIIDSGVLGRIVQVRMVWHQFTRRWDWQTLRHFGGGLLNNNGSHLLDHALQLLPKHVEPQLFVDLQRVLSLGDAEDHIKIVLQAEGQPTIDLELTNACAFPQDRWLIMGSAGGLSGATDYLEWRTVDWATLPPRQLEREAAADRKYNLDAVEWRTQTWRKPADLPSEYVRFYEDLYSTIRDGRELVITPASVRRLIATLGRCHAQCPQLV